MILTILIFIIILGILVFVHEFGHFVVAKRSGMKIDEFGFGFPPRLVGIQKTNGKWRWVWGHRSPLPNPPPQGEGIMRGVTAVSSPLRGEAGGGDDNTVYSINWIPLGGFVKILGEDNEHKEDPRSFINRPAKNRFFTLIAGVTMNLLLAWALISIGHIVGLPVAVDDIGGLPRYAIFKDKKIGITEVVPDLPAFQAGVKAGDIVVSVDNQTFDSVEALRSYIRVHAGQTFNFQITRSDSKLNLQINSLAQPPEGQGPTGIALAYFGKLSTPWYLAFWEGAKTTSITIQNIFIGIYQLITGELSWKVLGGPVKIAQLTGEASRMGFIYIMQFTAFLSLNLAILNFLPFPALDGGRILLLIIEKVRRRRNNPKVEQILNTAGFIFLILLMILVTIKDIKTK
jgi:regulator of sigma E protease